VFIAPLFIEITTGFEPGISVFIALINAGFEPVLAVYSNLVFAAPTEPNAQFVYSRFNAILRAILGQVWRCKVDCGRGSSVAKEVIPQVSHLDLGCLKDCRMAIEHTPGLVFKAPD
jgi:hypothetical protein